MLRAMRVPSPIIDDHDEHDHDPTPLRLVAPDLGANRARERRLSRRIFIGAAIGGTAATGLTGVASAADPDPFTLGVASGDPSTDGMVLWTRLAVDPLAEDGLGGMGARRSTVRWQLSSDEDFATVLRSGTVATGPAQGHAVHIEVDGLKPDRWYYYRFRTGNHVSPTARTRTLPAADSTKPLHAIAVSCAHYESGWFTAYHHAAQEDPDLVFALGDYIYEGAGVEGRTRVHPGSTCVSLADYRRRYALYKAEVETQELHHVAPWVVTWDDHEVQDNWAGIHPKDGVPTDAFEARRTAAYQAYYENMPLRRRSKPNGASLDLYRRLSWGTTADLHILDTRQYRDLQICHDGGKTWWFSDCPERDDPDRTMLGNAQTDWLLDGLASSQATWQVLAQGVFFSHRDISEGPTETLAADGWDGYRVNRNLVRDSWVEAGHTNATVLTGDVHAAFANEIKSDFDDPDSATVGVELIATSVGSGNDGYEENDSYQVVLDENPHIKWINGRRGYLSVEWTQDLLTARYMAVPYISTPGAPLELKRAYEIPAGEPGLNLA